MRMFLATCANPHFERYGVQDIVLLQPSYVFTILIR